MFARETGRTLVIPPAQKFYLVNRPAVSFADMFPVEYLEDYMDIMTMEVRGWGGGVMLAVVLTVAFVLRGVVVAR